MLIGVAISRDIILIKKEAGKVLIYQYLTL